MMPMSPKLNNVLREKKCAQCGQIFPEDEFAATKSFLFKDGRLPICGHCIGKRLQENDYSWKLVDKLCQLTDIPFIPKTFTELLEVHGAGVFTKYAEVFQSREFESLGWDDYDKEYRRLKAEKLLEDELPLISDAKYEELTKKWGANYDHETLDYLENLYNGLLSTQNVNGALQADQALKICKISYELDCRIRAGADFDKILTAYDKLVKTAEFTPKNVKNLNDFDTIGELIRWMEKRGWKSNYYDGVTKDIVDETIKNIQTFNRRLYINESGIGEEITRRIEMLSKAEESTEDEGVYDLKNEYNLDEFENDGYAKLLEDEEFVVDLDGDA